MGIPAKADKCAQQSLLSDAECLSLAIAGFNF